jgi:2'-5' RNA ligase
MLIKLTPTNLFMEKGIVKKQLMQLPQGVSEYLLLAHPDAATYTRIVAEIQFFSSQFGQAMAAKLKPHITVADFIATEQMEETLIRWMHRVISARQGFHVTLDRYGAFRPHTIYLNVRDQQPFLELARELRVVDQFIQGYGCPPMKLISNAHLTIARRLGLMAYQQAVQHYAQQDFFASFPIQELVLVKRRDQFDACRQVNVFRLRP